ncbi:MAG: SusC/RagA family TonB-linked outer membrane protein [Balneolaceae bacterium]
MMNKATNKPNEWLRFGIVVFLPVLLYALPVSSTATAGPLMEAALYQVEQQNDQLSELYVSQRDTQIPKVSLHVKNMLLIDVLHQLADELRVGISINTNRINGKRVSYQVRDKSVYEVLSDLLQETNLVVTLSDSRRALIVYEEEEAVEQQIEMMEGTVTGQVTDSETGETLIGVNILIEELGLGTSTNADGSFELPNVPAGEYQLEARYIGYNTLQRTVTITDNEETVLNLQMSVSTSELDELVVTALGITRSERSVGYSVQQVSGDDLTLTREQNVIGSLAGKVAGVQVTGASGASMGGTQKIKIRGVNSISGGDEPLIVVDGTPISNANFAGSSGRDYGNISQDINPEDVESVNVLKGPAASALYGIRGQYGVIMITTKKGNKGAERFSVELNSAFSMEQVGNIMPYQNKYGAGSTQSWLTLPNGDPYVQTNYDESWGPRMDGTPVRHYNSFYPQDPEYGQLRPFVPQPDNIKNYFETGTNFSQGVTIAGGGDNTTLRLSFNNTDIEGIEPNTFLKRNNVGVSAGVDITDKWNASTNVNFATNNARRPSQGAEAGSRYFGQWFQRNLDMNRLKDYQYDDGTFMHWNLTGIRTAEGEAGHFNPLYFNNPYFNAHENISDDSRDRLFGDVGVSFQALPELLLSGFIRSDMYTQNIERRNAFGGTGTPGYFTGKYQNTEMNYELLAQYDQRWNEISLNASAGTNLYDRKYSYVSQSTSGGLSAPGFYNISASIDRPNTNSYLLKKQVLSAYGLVSVGYMDTYFVDVSLRNDKSSALPEDNNSYWYPSVSGSLVFSELLDFEPLHLGKLRVSYAKAGSDLSPYQTTPSFLVGPEYGSISTLRLPGTLNNPNIKPSFANSYEAGFDLSFFSRFGIEFTYYHQKNENQIINLDVSGTSGYGAATINAGLIENKGVELTLNATPIQNQVFSWDASFNINRNRGEVVELYPGIDVYNYSSTRYSSVTTYLNSFEGAAFGSIVGQAYQRDEATGKILLNDDFIPLYTDATHDFGSVIPDFNGGLQNFFYYRNFELGAMIDFQMGGQFFSRSQSLADRTGLSERSAGTNDLGNNVRDPLDEGGGVKVSGVNAETGEEVTGYADAKTYFGILGQRIAEEYIYDASYIKLREVRLGYNLDSSILQNLPFDGVRVSLIARNPMMIWQDAPKGLDPSELSAGSQSISWYESGQLNTVRSYGIDLNITF